MDKTFHNDVTIIGAGGAGLMCAIEGAKRGRSVAVLDHADKIGQKILISGGGRCNFTNLGATAEQYQSQNMHFCKSAFGQFTQYDFINMVEDYNIAYHEKKLGQQFCDNSAQQIVNMLLDECEKHGARIKTRHVIESVEKENDKFVITTNRGVYTSDSLVVATGGLSIPKIGATNFGYRLAKQFDLNIVETTPALVPFRFSEDDLKQYEGLSGISFDAIVTCGKMSFRENVLITHRGVSGPAILQISSYWTLGQEVNIEILPDMDWHKFLSKKREQNARQELKTILCEVLPKRFVTRIMELGQLNNVAMAQIGKKQIAEIENFFKHYVIKPNGTEGYRKAEVTLGGVCTNELNAKTLESKKVPNMHFIGEVVDVTGWLGGYNFQWAWSSGYAAGQVV